ncbi:protein FAM200C-like [Lycorma delicatula]|uniref:protein FAM200C-like n=1 Tax=Lycorma delicatula TaxID=130591 RepID=UPI003F51A5CE
MQLDEPTIADNNALLLAYVCYFDEDNTLREEMLFAINLITVTTTGLSILNTMKSYFTKNNIPLNNIVACATNGAQAMIVCYCGFVAYVKEEVPNILCIHYMVHRQHLVGKHLSTSLHSSLTIIIH